MLKSYLLIALRKLLREKLYVAINILSLALGIAGFLVLGLYLRSELTYDQHHANHERIYRLTQSFHPYGSETPDDFAITSLSLGPTLVRDFPQLGRYARLRASVQNVLSYEDNSRQWERIYLADPTVFDIFTHKIVYGDPKQAFANPYSIAISESMAKYYFGETNPIDKKVQSGDYTYAVTLVFADLPENTHLKYDALIPMAMMDVFVPGFSTDQASLAYLSMFTYLEASEAFDPRTFDAIAEKFVAAHMELAAMDAATGRSIETVALRWQSLDDIHFGEKLIGDVPIGNIIYVYGFGIVAVFVLGIACINYVNLATARALRRAKEVGMRKVLGASRAQLAAQFLGEAAVFVAIALVVALIVMYAALVLTPLGTLMGKEKLLAELANPLVLLGIVAVGLVVAIIAGLYPAFYLSSISPLAALSHVRSSWKTGFSLRQALVFAQLAISIGVIACTLLMIEQMQYVHERPLGFDKENRLVLTLRGANIAKNVQTIRNELRSQANVIDVTHMLYHVPGAEHGMLLMGIEKTDGVFEQTPVHALYAGLNFTQALDIEMVEGRPFSEAFATEATRSVLVNESMVRKMGWESPLGKRFDVGGGTMLSVIGVTPDFHYASLHNPVGPLVMLPIGGGLGPVPFQQRRYVGVTFVVVLSGDKVRETLRAIESVIVNFDPKFNFEPVFLEDRLNQLYKTETNLMRLTGVFAAVCILISAMGIFGLAAFTTEQRTKEIGIRKVLGASDAQILAMLSRPLLWLVLAAAVPASYAGYRAIDVWLQRFAYHTDIDVMTFVFATLAVCVVALATVVVQSLRTTRANPADALRYE